MRTAVAIIIPARLGSTRLKRKLLLKETGRPLLAHTAERALEAQRSSNGLISQVIVAVDHGKLKRALRAEITHVKIVTTKKTHKSGTDRIIEAVEKLGVEEDIILNLQGDEPEISVDNLLTLARLLSAPETALMATLAAPAGEEELRNPNVVKVVLDAGGYALYFSRAQIPFEREKGDAAALKYRCLRHLGLYAYRREFLLKYKSLPASGLETCERLEQLRALEAGYRIRVAIVKPSPPGVDTAADYEAFVNRMKKGGKK
jgi:3-deoxy-manno-octulosonate cytidylyltransferase (CMP-KDO synthetase)